MNIAELTALLTGIRRALVLSGFWVSQVGGTPSGQLKLSASLEDQSYSVEQLLNIIDAGIGEIDDAARTFPVYPITQRQQKQVPLDGRAVSGSDGGGSRRDWAGELAAGRGGGVPPWDDSDETPDEAVC